MDTTELVVGDVVLVRPGERVGADGDVLAGASEVDQASITGEPLPVLKEHGDEVFAGTLNGTGALRIRVSRAARDSVVARIVALVQEASATKAQAQLFIEKVEQRYSVSVVLDRQTSYAYEAVRRPRGRLDDVQRILDLVERLVVGVDLQKTACCLSSCARWRSPGQQQVRLDAMEALPAKYFSRLHEQHCLIWMVEELRAELVGEQPAAGRTGCAGSLR